MTTQSIEVLGKTCADGGTCHHLCTNECFRKTCCVPLSGSGLDDNWEPIVSPYNDRTVTYVDDDNTILFNGLFNVKNRIVKYRGFTIRPKLDFGSNSFLVHANRISTGWVVVDSTGCLAMPGATWSESILAARASIDIWIESGFNADKYWELMKPFRY